jgi:hypothetical protein
VRSRWSSQVWAWGTSALKFDRLAAQLAGNAQAWSELAMSGVVETAFYAMRGGLAELGANPATFSAFVANLGSFDDGDPIDDRVAQGHPRGISLWFLEVISVMLPWAIVYRLDQSWWGLIGSALVVFVLLQRRRN